MADRIFCPLESRWFDLIKAGRKIWEFRDSKSPVGRQISKRIGFDLSTLESISVFPNLSIEFRRGYNGESVLGDILEIKLYSTPENVGNQVLHEGCVVRDDLHSIWPLCGHLVAIRFEIKPAQTAGPASWPHKPPVPRELANRGLPSQRAHGYVEVS